MKQQGLRRSLTRCTEHHRCNRGKQAVTTVTTIKWQKECHWTQRRYLIGHIFEVKFALCICDVQHPETRSRPSSAPEHTRLHTHVRVYTHLSRYPAKWLAGDDPAVFPLFVACCFVERLVVTGPGDEAFQSFLLWLWAPSYTLSKETRVTEFPNLTVIKSWLGKQELHFWIWTSWKCNSTTPRVK